MQNMHINSELIEAVADITKSIYPLIPTAKKYIFTAFSDGTYKLFQLEPYSDEKIIGRFSKHDKYKINKDFATVAAFIDPEDYGERYVYELLPERAFKFYFMGKADDLPSAKHSIYKLDFGSNITSREEPPAHSIYTATCSDGFQSFAAYIIKDKHKEIRKIIPVPITNAFSAEEAENYAAGAARSELQHNAVNPYGFSVYKYSEKDIYKSKKINEVLEKAHTMLKSAGLCK